jgi:hypothetical protein
MCKPHHPAHPPPLTPHPSPTTHHPSPTTTTTPQEERNKIGFDLPDMVGQQQQEEAPAVAAAGEADMDLGDEEYDPGFPG